MQSWWKLVCMTHKHYTHTQTHTHTQIHTRTHTDTCTHTQIHAHTHAHTHRYIHTHTLTHRCTHMRRKENKQVQLVFPTSGPNTCMVHLPRGKQLHTVQARIKPKIVWKYMRGQNNTAKQLCPNGLVRGKGGVEGEKVPLPLPIPSNQANIILL